MAMDKNKVYLKIKRQAGPNLKPYYEIFMLDYYDTDTLLTLLGKLSDHPNTVEGKETTPVNFEYNCKEEACGACAIRVNGTPLMACSTLVKNLPYSSYETPILLEPLQKFQVIKDLTVDRERIFENQSIVKNWVDVEDFFGEPLKYEKEKQFEMYQYSKCINCGCCYDACPRTDITGKFYLGPSAISQVVKLCSHLLGKKNKRERVRAIMSTNGLAKCGKAQVCEKVCPKRVPLVASVSKGNREAIKEIFHINL